MLEVEIKLRLEDEVIKKLEDKGCQFTKPIKQVDYIYIENEIEGFNLKPGSPILRIRQEEDKSIFTFKKKESDEFGRLEYETIIEDPTQMRLIFKALNFKEIVCVKKERKFTTYNEFTICIDQVESLGSFIEIEMLIEDDGNKEESYNKILDFIKELNIPKDNIVTEKYDVMMYQLENK